MNLRIVSSNAAIVGFGLALFGVFGLCGRSGMFGERGIERGHQHDPHHAFAVGGKFGVVSMGPPSSVVQERPDLCVLDLPATFSFEGDLQGRFSSEFHIEHYGRCDQPAPERFVSEGVWIGALLDHDGSFAYRFEGEIDAEARALGRLLIKNGTGTGELERLRGMIRLDGITGVGGGYAGEVGFD